MQNCAVPAVSGNGRVDVGTFKHVEDDTRDNLAIAFQANACKGRDERRANLLRNEGRNPVICYYQDYTPQSVMS